MTATNVRFIEAKTRWIADDGRRDASPQDLFPRVTDQTAHFVLHTLGWIQVTYFGQTYELWIDPRSVRQKAIQSLKDWLWRMHDDDPSSPWLVCISCFTGRDWVRQTDTRPHSLIEFIDRMIDFGMPPQIPQTLTFENKPLDHVASFANEDLAALIERWRLSRQGLSVDDPFIHRLLSSRKVGCTVKLLSLDRVGRVVFGTYLPSLTTLWQADVSGSFIGAPVNEAVPDRALGSAVERSARLAMQLGVPSVQVWNGPVLSSSGIVADLEWDRLTVPLNNHGRNDTVLVVTHRRSPVRDQVAG